MQKHHLLLFSLLTPFDFPLLLLFCIIKTPAPSCCIMSPLTLVSYAQQCNLSLPLPLEELLVQSTKNIIGAPKNAKNFGTFGNQIIYFFQYCDRIIGVITFDPNLVIAIAKLLLLFSLLFFFCIGVFHFFIVFTFLKCFHICSLFSHLSIVFTFVHCFHICPLFSHIFIVFTFFNSFHICSLFLHQFIVSEQSLSEQMYWYSRESF